MKKKPVTEYVPLKSFLKGNYAYCYTAFWRAEPAYNKVIPQLGGFYESPTKLKQFDQVPGYALGSFAGYINFDGNGSLIGKGKTNRGGIDIADITYTGTYTVAHDLTTGVFTGTFQTGTTDFINHYFIMADNWKELKFIILNTYLRQPVTSGSLVKI